MDKYLYFLLFSFEQWISISISYSLYKDIEINSIIE
jgi:hypothetical protein